MHFLAHAISYLSNPLIVSFPAAFSLVYYATGKLEYSLFWAAVSFIFAGSVAAFVLYGIKRGFFSDIDVSIRLQRDKLFGFVIFISLLYSFIIIFFNGPKILLISMIGIVIGTAVAGLVNTKIKASMHVAVFSCFIYSLALMYKGGFVYGIFLIPLIAWSRITVKRHTTQETIIGGILGVTFISIIYVLLKFQGITL